MKDVFLFIFIMNTCLQSSSNLQARFSVTIWDYNYSMAYTTQYRISNDSLIVNNISGIQNEGNKALLERRLTQSEEKKIHDFLSLFPLDSLSNEYKNPLVQDGDRKKVEIKFNNKIKVIELESVYQKDMDDLFNTVNQMLEKNMKIKYEK